MAILLTLSSASGMMLAARAPTRVPAVRMAYTDVVRAAQERAAAVKADQDATIAATATGFIGFFALPTIDNFFADFFLSTVVAGVIGVVAGFREDGLGDAARAVGGGVSKAVGTVAGPAIDKAKDLAGDGLSMNDVKKYGVAGTIAYILTELAFWAVAFPVASTTFYNTAGQWPARTRTLTPNRDPDPGPHPSLTRRATGPTLATEVIARRSSARSSWAPTSRGWLSRCASAWPSPPRRGSTRTSSRGLALQATARPRPHSRSNYAGKSSTVLVSTS